MSSEKDRRGSRDRPSFVAPAAQRPVAALDAAVLVPAGIRDVLLSLASGGLFRPVWQSEILDETRRNVIKRELRRIAMHELDVARETVENDVEKLIATMNSAFPDAWQDVALWVPLVRQMTNQRKDRHVLAVAVGAQATHVVTSNLRDFPLESKPAGIEVVGPDAFTLALLDRDPDRVLAALTRKVERHHRPPTTLSGLAHQLMEGTVMPVFGNALLTLIGEQRDED